MKLIYKTLFEVKILHEFYQTEKAGNTIFDLDLQENRMSFLKQRFYSMSKNINSDLQFIVPESAKSLFKDYLLKLIPSYSGFKVLCSVKAKLNPSGITSYEPIQKLPDDLLLPVLLLKKNSNFHSITSEKLENSLDSYYLFSNDNLYAGDRTAPYLTSEIPNYIASQTYEQGELARFAANELKYFYWDSSNTAQWKIINGKTFANPQDKVLIPLNTFYSFPKNKNITKAEFLLKDINGNIIQEFHFKKSNTLKKVHLAFDPNLIHTIPTRNVDNKAVYTLEVSGNAGFNRTHKVLFFDQQNELRESIGMVIIKMKSSLNGYKILDATGKLITKKNENNIMDPPAPIFEINFRSKASFWRYINSKNNALKNGIHAEFLISNEGALITKIPKSLTSNTILFKKADDTLLYLPNPNSSEAPIYQNNKIYNDIRVQESSLFPIEP